MGHAAWDWRRFGKTRGHRTTIAPQANGRDSSHDRQEFFDLGDQLSRLTPVCRCLPLVLRSQLLNGYSVCVLLRRELDSNSRELAPKREAACTLGAVLRFGNGIGVEESEIGRKSDHTVLDIDGERLDVFRLEVVNAALIPRWVEQYALDPSHGGDALA
jgi:hypothetical protein